MAPITNIARSLATGVASNAASSTTHQLAETPFRQLSLWAYLAFVVIFLTIAAVLGYMIYSCYRSSAVDVEAIQAQPQCVDSYTEAKLTSRVNGRVKKNNVQSDRTKRRGIVTFSDKSKVLVRSKDLGAANPSGTIIHGQQRSQVKPLLRVVTNADVSITSNSSTCSTEYGGDSYTLDSPPLVTPPRAYLHSSHRRAPVKRMIGVSPKTPTTPIPIRSVTDMTPIPLTAVTSYPTPVITIHPSDVKYDLHNIRFVLPREKSTENLENARLWQDPKLSPVGGSIIYPYPKPLSPAGIPVGKHMSPVTLHDKDLKKNKGAPQTGVALNTKITTRRK